MSYGKVHSKFWTDRKVRAMSEPAKVLALYLLTGPHRNLLGAMRVPDGYIGADLGWTEKRTAEARGELAKCGFVVCGQDGWIFIVNQLRYDPLQNRNQAVAAWNIFDEIDDEAIRPVAAARLLDALEPFKEAFDIQKAALKALLERYRNPIETPSEPLPTPVPAPAPLPAPAPEPDICALAVGLWNDLAQDTGLPSVQVLSDERRGHLRKRLVDCGGIDGWSAAMAKVRDSPFLLGKNKDGWKADFDFLLRKSKFIKLMEGGYDGQRNNFNNGFAQLASEGGLESL
jgi:hypothetical protein